MPRQFRLILLLILLAPEVLSQDAIQEKFNNAYSLSQQKNYRQALAEFKSIVDQIPAHSPARLQASWCYLILGDVVESVRQADLAMMMDPFYQAVYSMKAYAGYASGDPDAEKFLKLAIWMSSDDSILQYFLKDYDDLIDAGVKPQVFRRLKTTTTELFRTRNKTFGPVINSIGKAQQLLGEGNVQDAVIQFENAVRTASFPPEFSHFRALTVYFAAIMLANYQYWNESRPFFEGALNEFAQYPQLSAYARAALLSRMANMYIALYDDEKALSLLKPYLAQALTLPPEAITEKAMFVDAICKAELNLNNIGDLRVHAQQLLDLSGKTNDPSYYPAALNYLGVAYHMTALAQDRIRAAEFFQAGIQAARNAGLEDLEMSIKMNYANNLFSQRQYESAMQLNTEVAGYHIRKNDFIGAETVYNNLGAMCYGIKDYRNAVAYLGKSIEIVEKYRNEYTGEDKLNFMAKGVSSQQFLVACLAALGDSKALFEAQNLDRGRTLAELIKNDVVRKPVSLQEFQRTLKNDEAALIYSMIESGNVVINLVTATSARALVSDGSNQLVELKEKYLNRFNGNGKKAGYRPYINYQDASESMRASQLSQQDVEDMVSIARDLMPRSVEPFLTVRTAFLKMYYDLLITPAAQHLAGIKKLLIMPDGILNFLPFEALIGTDGKYLVEQFEIRYTQSAQVKNLIEARNYGSRPKELLAMGGANYEQMNVSAAPVNNAADLVMLRNLAHQNTLRNASQRQIYASLGFRKLNYLPGTLEEVTAISKLFPGSCSLHTGNDMTENFIKSLSRNRELARYRIVHLATHGFAIPEIPELSGIAMSIPATEQGGEDGYLTAAEISKLGLQADLAVLSACETALGKIYGGEGVAGLTQALLIAGANRAIVTLWPVNDLGTMHFMRGFYNLIKNEGKDPAEAVNIMKRKFISGDFGPELTSPEMWAPFVHYGK